ncbi:MAG: alpha/beta hydrolase [Planctomycetaceae bacterium]|nr:MAG: alpha/beta hydrolase [Planctomycetaceae bacterium]
MSPSLFSLIRSFRPMSMDAAAPIPHRYRLAVGGWCLLLALTGCTIRTAPWYGFGIPATARFNGSATAPATTLPEAQSRLLRAQWAKICGDESCVDLFFQSARLAWCELANAASGRPSPVAVEVYHAAVAEMVSQGQRFERFHASHGLRVYGEDGEFHVPVAYVGTGWGPGRFDQLVLTDLPHSKGLNRYHRRQGIGVPVIAVRQTGPQDRFLPPRLLASATVVLRPAFEPPASSGPSMVLEIHDPLRSTSVDLGDRSWPLAGDYSAPIKLGLDSNSSLDRLRAFVQPWQTRPEQVGLVMTEPYQPGKIPVLFVHGLFSDRYTWANVLNELRVAEDLRDRYQFWGYQYPTGEPFLRSAARLRRELRELRGWVDPSHADPTLDQVVIVGHSMGGLIGKLQVTSSEDRLWQAIATRPLEEIVIDPQGRNNLSDMLFFEPSPMVSRVVFVGTPHRGSGLAQRGVGRLAACLVEESAETSRRHRDVLRANPGVFSSELSRRIPNSIDLLEPSSNLLRTIDRLPISSRVPYHSIVGRGCRVPLAGESDGVVPLDSALIEGAASQTAVESRHTTMTRDPQVIGELMRILREHRAAVDRPSSGVIWESAERRPAPLGTDR